tara:strand:- start:6347 stop:8596 length:2250 start_codon:yes stop_codon:yes gene_type:complete
MSNQLKFKFKKKSKNTKIIIGLLLFFTSLFLFFSFNSFWFNWQLDDDTITSGWNEISNLNSNKASNLLGWLGAYVSYFFISNLGLTSYGLLVILTLLSIKLTFNFKLNYYLATKRIIFFMMWLTIFLGISMKNLDLTGYTYGLAGLESYNILNLLIGDLGIIMLLTIWVIITIIISNKLPSIKFKKPLFKSVNFSLPTKKEFTNNTNKFDPIQKNNSDIENTNESTKIKPDFKIKKQENEKTLANLTPNFDPKLELRNYIFPSLDVLKEYDNKIVVNKEELEQNKSIIIETLLHFKIEITAMNAEVGPTITLYEIVPKEGIKISKIKNLEDDIALRIKATGVRIIAPLPGKGTVGIEVPNQKPSIVSMKSVISSEKFQKTKFELPIAIGKTISNETYITDLTKMPHLLMAGATGQGKSVGLNAIICSILFKKHPSEVKFVLIDPKKVELTLYNKIERHFLAKLPNNEDAIITNTKEVITTLKALCVEMDNRYDLLKIAGTRNITEYNQKFKTRKLNPKNGHKFLPYIILVIDEFADLIMTAGKEIEIPLARLAQLARAIGIHLIIATQRPTTNIITGTIKANFPVRIAFRVSQGIDSKTILDTSGANQLIGRGDMLISTGNEILRIQCAFIDTPEVEKITSFIEDQKVYPKRYDLPEYSQENESNSPKGQLKEKDIMFEDAARLVVLQQHGSTSMLQRKMKLGYNRAGRIMDELEMAGIVGKSDGSRSRKVLITNEEELIIILNKIKNE